MRHAFILGGLSGLALASSSSSSSPITPSSPPHTDPLSSASEFNWSSITPSRNLSFHACYGGDFHCARLVLPLDWTAVNASHDDDDDDNTRAIALAIIKLPATVPPTHAAYAGPLFTNPGGPGGSGVSFVRAFGHRLQSIASIPGQAHYDIISFDPRGMANSWPRADCFPGDGSDGLVTRDAMLLQARGSGALDSGPGAVPFQLGLQEGFGQRCRDAEESGLNGGQIMAYMSTPSVARDMVAMVDKLDELHKREVGRDAAGDGEDDRLELKKRHGADGHDNDYDDVPRLQYVGFSYGTLLGNYFASLFPERIGRLVLDGVCDANDYASGPGWLTSTLNADDIVTSFFSGCHTAGPSTCALSRPSDSSGESIRARLHDFIQKMDDRPLVVPLPSEGSSSSSSSSNVAVLTANDVRRVMSNAIYKPIQQFRPLASALDGLMSGRNATAFAALVAAASLVPRLRDACAFNGSDPSSPQSLAVDRREAGSSVLCADGDDVTAKDTAWWRRYVAEQVSLSSLMGAYWSTIRFSCSAWRFRSNWSFKGPFTTPEPVTTPDGRPVKGKPAAPILFLSNSLDPVTPLRSARAMAAAHPGARLVIQDALGHCALATADSTCTKRLVAHYLATGKVPSDEETDCRDTTCGPWDEGCELDHLKQSLGAFGQPDHGDRQHYPLGI
ncbi:hypothetical protein JDV02_002973 [Purpureocillium takamizusanense]|uniref:Peptidase S33 tripeptidyl aminopeptidase-like C-terminal domain-containing protein n=1 Tax=Purpureocillium takamizusanense TaxID=2060973 RepID=A0A9Q8V990_9HYPO|nr:uncharacterized protein JDV02_002973 [Purpureocillium takamizusanense]UNI16547.1 hypothetical protein JDV02_002973 [Purpureocillium takamizusanense]